VWEVREQISIPLAVKVGPYFSSIPNMAERLVEAGAGALVLFNRFYQPDIDLEKLEVVPTVNLSNSQDLLLPLRWTALLRGRVDTQFAVTSGVWEADDVVKAILVGADVAMLASALLTEGPEHVVRVLADLQAWLDEHEYESTDQMRGSMAVGSAPNPDAFVRANYMKMLITYTNPGV
jgi:dihydroorotate dehydrogenase (fumarate)